MQQPRVAILAYPDLCAFEFGCATELFALKRPDLSNWYQTDIIGINSGPFKATGGVQLMAEKTLIKQDDFKPYDWLIIPGWSGVNEKVPDILVHALRNYYKRRGKIVSFCSGAFVLGATGLLDGKTATTHWAYEDAFRKQFPLVCFQENVLYTEDEGLYTSAGSAAALDLGLHIIRQDFGTSIANQVAKRLVISPHREGGQAQYAAKKKPAGNQLLNESLQWASNNLHKNISVNQMADKACLTRRSFDRHFRATMGMSPKEWLIRQRINLAQDYLESTRVSMEQIADKSGFGSAMNLRHHFSKILGISPSYYRRQFTDS